MIDQILKDDWYKTATPQEMRVALTHLQMNASDQTINDITMAQKETRQRFFEECAEASGWNKEQDNV